MLPISLSNKFTKSKRPLNNTRAKRRRRPRRNIFWKRGSNKIMRSLTNTEVKYVDTTGQITPNTSQTTVSLNVMSQGTTVSTRLGNSIRVLSIKLNCKYAINSSATHTTMRTIILKDSQANGGVISAANVFSAPTNVISLLNPDSQYRIVVYHLECLSVSISGTQEQVLRFDEETNFVTRFNGNAGTIADVVTNSVIIGFTSDESTNTPTIDYYARICFIDD